MGLDSFLWDEKIYTLIFNNLSKFDVELLFGCVNLVTCSVYTFISHLFSLTITKRLLSVTVRRNRLSEHD